MELLAATRFVRSACMIAAAALLAVAGPVAAQEPEGVRLTLTYQTQFQPGLVVLPFEGDAAGGTVAGIVRRDLDWGDRFKLATATDAAAPRPGEPLNLALWRERGADWVVSGTLQPRAGGLSLRLTLHDAVYGQPKGSATFALPPAGAPGFRMAVHAASDEVVRWAFGEPGTAASRIAFVRQGRGAKEVYLVDSDGENVERVTGDGSIALSPAWSTDGRRLAYTSYRAGTPTVYERDLAAGRDRVLSDRPGLNLTPAYGAGGRIAWAATAGGNTEIVLREGDGIRQQTQGSQSDALSPSFSPDGSRIAFVSNALGEPHIYVAPLGGAPRLLTPYVGGQRGHHTSPDWSPKGTHIAYHTRVGGTPQIAAIPVGGGRPALLTRVGSNEDPSWAPDGRHIVFASTDRDGGGLFVIDVVSGRIRPLLRGRGFGLPAWSPVLLRSAGN